MSKPRNGTPSAVAVAIANGGYRNAWVAVTWVMDWGLVRAATDDLGSNLSARTLTVGEWWGYSESKAWRRQRAFARCFPMWRSPDDLLDYGPNEALRVAMDKLGRFAREHEGGQVDERSPAVADALALITSAKVAA